MKNLFVLGIMYLAISCKPEDILPNKMIILGDWKLVEYKINSRNDWYKPFSEVKVEFKATGAIKYNNNDFLYEPFGEGWCNQAVSYKLKGDRLYFKFGKPECIPIVIPNTPPYGVVQQISKNDLEIEWWGRNYRFRR
jgi:hypothetical protein